MTDPRRVLVVGYHAAELLDISCVTTALTVANYLRGEELYRVVLATPGGRPIHTGSGLVLQAQDKLERITGPLDTLVVSGGIGYVEAMDDRRLVAHVRRLAMESRRVAAVCTGAGVLAAAGLLDGRRAATHWDHAAPLSVRFPQVTFDGDPIFVTDGPFCTSAGVTSALDLTLSFIEDDVGADLARGVARQLVTYLQRPGNQAQMSMYTAAPAARNSLVQDTIDHVAGHLADDLSSAVLAERAGVSERHLTRLFLREVEDTPGRFVRRARTEAAAQLLTTTDLTMEAVASRCGFGTPETLRQAFQSRYGVSPSHYRATQSRCAPVLVS
ncbi:MAG: helix-turn-helix domain-containing protein [Nocardioides sp.]|jgi:transcriptional regulator GlxA family with amidase domain